MSNDLDLIKSRARADELEKHLVNDAEDPLDLAALSLLTARILARRTALNWPDASHGEQAVHLTEGVIIHSKLVLVEGAVLLAGIRKGTFA